MDYELKLDGYRAIAVKSGKATVYSRRGTDLTQRFRYVADALANLPDETVIDGELVALDEQGKPNFNLLQNCGYSLVVDLCCLCCFWCLRLRCARRYHPIRFISYADHFAILEP
jgi:hypothetical protein